MMKRMKELEDETRRLKKMYADERLKAEMVQEALANFVWPPKYWQNVFEEPYQKI